MNGAHCVVIDTNVLAVAEGMHDGASTECRDACLRIATRVSEGQRIAVDSAGAIFDEYLRTLVENKTAGLPAKLMRILYRRRHDNAVCHQVDVDVDDHGTYVDVPDALRDFDDDDHKFFAVALAAGDNPPVLQALDEEWWRRRADIQANGVDLQFICLADNL